MTKDKWLILYAIENYLLLTNTFSSKNNYLIDYLYKLHLYHSVHDLEYYLENLKDEYFNHTKTKKVEFKFNWN